MRNQDDTADSLFRSFWMGGFEGACHINSLGQRLDMVAATQHDLYVDEDYGRLAEADIRVARESLRWPLIERPGGGFDFRSVMPMLGAANDNGIQVIWTLCHYGWPDGLDLFAPEFVDRFARFAGAAAQCIADHSALPPLYSPVNEISFICWAVCCGGIMYPYPSHAGSRAHELKRQLVRASIAAMEAVWDVDPRARMVHIDPLIHIVAPPGRPDLADAARAERHAMFEAWDMLRGARDEDLGGHPKYLDIVGVNYYHCNQWEHLTQERLHWHLGDPRRLPLHQLLLEVYERYRVPLFIGETSHVGSGRAQWIREIGREVRQAQAVGVPVEGVCLYPIVDRTDWDNDAHWHNSGLWDVSPAEDGRLKRVLHADYAAALQETQQLFGSGEYPSFPYRRAG